MAESIYDELDDPDPDVDEPTQPAEEAPTAGVFVCDHVDESGELCGATFDASNKLSGHKWGKHRDKNKDRAPSGGARPKKSRGKPQARAAAKATPAPAGNRSETYASSIAMMALGAYLVVPPFDTYDLDVVNRGAGNLADALATAAEQNATIRTTCDLILGGGAGGAYIQLLLALSAIVVPICAHHGVVPVSAGERFGSMIGGVTVPVASAEEPPSPPASSASSGQPDFANMGPEDVLAFFSQVPPTVLFDLAGKMFGNMDPTVIDIGAVPQGEPMREEPPVLNLSVEQSAEEPDVERGSEQLAPDSIPVPA